MTSSPQMQPSPAGDSRTAAMLVGIIVPVVWVGAAAVSILPIGMSVMLFDAPGSTESALTVGLFVSLASFPVLALVSALVVPVLAFLAKRAPERARYRRRLRAAIVVAGLPVLSALAVVVFIALITVVCGGELSC